jgi:ATP-dependent DNA ligase
MPTGQLRLPKFIAILSAEPPKGEGWIHEIKHDGFRTLLRIDGTDVRAFSRGGHDWSDKYGRIIEAAGKLRCRSALIDGEVIVQDKNGLSDFAALRTAMEAAPHRLVMFAFDLLFLDGEDLRRLPLIERRARLNALLPRDTRRAIQFSDHYEGQGAVLFKQGVQWALKALCRNGRSVLTRAAHRSSGSRPRTWWRAS